MRRSCHACLVDLAGNREKKTRDGKYLVICTAPQSGWLKGKLRLGLESSCH